MSYKMKRKKTDNQFTLNSLTTVAVYRYGQTVKTVDAKFLYILKQSQCISRCFFYWRVHGLNRYEQEQVRQVYRLSYVGYNQFW